MPLFLHERHQTSKDVRYNDEWLQINLVVKEVTRIERVCLCILTEIFAQADQCVRLQQRTLSTGTSRFVRSSPASAAATIEKGTLLLRISSNLNDLDYYEVAAALTSIILSKQRIHDTLLFMTLLQTSLRDLKRRGFNVDKIMNARRAEQEAIEQKQRQERTEAEIKRINGPQPVVNALPPPYVDESRGLPPPSSSSDEKQLSKERRTQPQAPPGSRSLFNSFRDKLRGNPLVPPSAVDAVAGREQFVGMPGGMPLSPTQPGKTSAPDPESQGE